ncbi:F/Y-rich N-terminus-domain-containing protein [Spinellus fusiger]|nr:F/Y-rich N-terminus-domain-containing protein [Spinellus fusiger]
MNVKDPDACSDINLDTKQPQSSLSTSSKSYDYYNSDAPAIIPVVYAPSNKKRKKSSPIICTEASSTDIIQQTQGISTAIRTYYEVDRNDKGDYILPVEIDSWTVVDLGIVFWDRPAYHNQRYIYPVNYTVRKWYRSMVDPKSDTQYTCRILENGREPKFEVTADDCPITYSGPTPTTVWTIIVRRAFAIRNQEYGHNPVGPDFFGLRKNTIAKMIQDLRNAEKCSQYVWQTFEPARFNKPGRNRRRTDSTFSSGLCGGVNYSLTSNRVSNNSSILFTPRYTVSAAGSSKIVNESKPQTLKIEETTPASMEHNIFPPNNSTSMAQIHHSTPLSSPLPLPSIKIA